jgi:hypothetical protein
VLAPWEESRNQLVSWWQMLQFSAKAFFWCGRALRTIREDCLIGAAICVNGESVIAMGQDLDDQARKKALSSLSLVEVEVRKISMAITADTVKELIVELKNQSRHSFEWLHNQVESIERLADKELRGKLFLYIPPERGRFWPRMNSQHIFRDDVGAAFPSATYDEAESGICLALARGSACVFHLMRVLEIGLTVLGAKFGVSLAHTNWGPAIGEIESKIREIHKDPAWKSLPDCKEQQEFYAQVASHFDILRDAWRNYTMHTRGFYTEEQAEQMFENVKGFMQKLSSRLRE